MKTDRQSRILKIIAEHPVETQDELLSYLRESGIDCTQATISRDIKELHISKQADAGGVYRYTVSQQRHHRNVAEKLRTIFRESVTTVDYAGNIVVLKTLPGLGSAAAAAVDSMELHSIVGSLAGDDTVFLVMRSEKNAAGFADELREML